MPKGNSRFYSYNQVNDYYPTLYCTALKSYNISHTLSHNISSEFYSANIISAGERTEAQADKVTCPPWLLRDGVGREDSDPSLVKHTIFQREQGTERITAQRGCC